MTESVMANVFREAKTKAIDEYKQLMLSGLVALRNDDIKRPLD